jgi:hypothetical protein
MTNRFFDCKVEVGSSFSRDSSYYEMLWVILWCRFFIGMLICVENNLEEFSVNYQGLRHFTIFVK